MDFDHLQYAVSQNQYDEIKVIGKTIVSDGLLYHFAALMRQGEEVRLCMLVQQPEPWDAHIRAVAKGQTMRQFYKQERHGERQMSLRALKIEGDTLEVSGSTGSGLDLPANAPEVILLFGKLMEAGWKVPEDAVFHADGSCLSYEQITFCEPMKALPELGDADVIAVWDTPNKYYAIEKRFKLCVTDEEEGVTGEKTLEFTVTGSEGDKREGICYIDRVERIDMYKEQEKRFADPEYQRRMLEHVSQEEFDQIKQEMLEATEQNCPRGMCYLGIEYECTLDMSLTFYSSDHLKSNMKAIGSGSGSTTIFLMSGKPEKEYGIHGLRLRGCVIQTPLPLDTKEIWAELFEAQEITPQKESRI